MSTNTEFKTIQFKRGIKSVLEAKLIEGQLGVPKAGEPVYEIDTGRLKIGDGKTAYKDLSYFGEKEGLDLKTFRFESEGDVFITDTIFHVLWLTTPTSTNKVKGFTIHPNNGKLYEVESNERTYSIKEYVTEENTIQVSEIKTLLTDLGF